MNEKYLFRYFLFFDFFALKVYVLVSLATILMMCWLSFLSSFLSVILFLTSEICVLGILSFGRVNPFNEALSVRSLNGSLFSVLACAGSS